MAFPNAHNYLVIHGTVENGGQSDVWQTGLRIGVPGQSGSVGSPSDMEAAMTDILADVVTWWTAIKPGYAASTKLVGIKFNAIGTDGKYVGTTSYAKDVTGGASPGTATGSPLPAQLAVAVTLHTAATRGHASKGRMYLPAPAVNQVTATGTISPGIGPLFRDNTATLVKNLNNWPGVDVWTPGNVLVMSSVGAGVARPVTGVSVGSRFDVQRRRANKIRETRTVVPIPA